jgi:hypothetical protein
VTVGRQAAAQGAVLDLPMQLFQLAQQIYKGFWLVCQLQGEA